MSMRHDGCLLSPVSGESATLLLIRWNTSLRRPKSHNNHHTGWYFLQDATSAVPTLMPPGLWIWPGPGATGELAPPGSSSWPAWLWETPVPGPEHRLRRPRVRQSMARIIPWSHHRFSVAQAAQCRAEEVVNHTARNFSPIFCNKRSILLWGFKLSVTMSRR